MAHAIDADNPNLIRDFVYHAMVANADTPVVPTASQPSATRRTRIPRERLNRRDDAVMHLRRQPGKVLFRGALKEDVLHCYARFCSAR
jgi:hypothetical protein